MKKTYLFIFFLLIACLRVSAAPSYGTKMPEKWQLFLGTEANYVFSRDLDRDLGNFNSGQAFITTTLGITDWFCIDAGIGGGSIRYNPNYTTEIDFPEGFAGKYGFRIKLYDKPDSAWKAVCGFQHISVHPKRKIVNNVKTEVIFDDWQLSLIGSYNDLGWFVPYAGAKISRGDLIERQDSIRKRRKSDPDDSFGAVAGCYLFLTDEWWVTMEGRWFDESATSFSVTHSF
ncbi:hypothetical protein ACFL5X_03890 [Candidatus Omnitrophota bacterium]